MTFKNTKKFYKLNVKHEEKKGKGRIKPIEGNLIEDYEHENNLSTDVNLTFENENENDDEKFQKNNK